MGIHLKIEYKENNKNNKAIISIDSVDRDNNEVDSGKIEIDNIASLSFFNGGMFIPFAKNQAIYCYLENQIELNQFEFWTDYSGISYCSYLSIHKN
ncbi:hypothetical protein M0R19_03500 [Candidatus Pacearchaeota archaeon]|jgi:hypothetical protein|nr:hypothetical protein [Candidatus Pacearchaeota archaeon]